jgi:hypothetical protein
VVRWRLQDKRFNRSRGPRGEAGDFITGLHAARSRGELFDIATRLPASMGAAPPVAAAPTFLSHAQDHVHQQWPAWAPKSHKNALASLLVAICALTDEPMPRAMAGAARSWLRDGWLRHACSPCMVRARSEGAWVWAPRAPESQCRVHANLSHALRIQARDELIARTTR